MGKTLHGLRVPEPLRFVRHSGLGVIVELAEGDPAVVVGVGFAALVREQVADVGPAVLM